MKDLFGNEVILPPKGSTIKKDRIAVHQYKQLIMLHGTTEGKKCKDCANCHHHQGGSKLFYKCHLATVSSGPATDWNSRWQACGKFEQDKKLLS